MNRLFWGIVAAVVLVSLAGGVAAIVGRATIESTRAQAEALRDGVREVRTALDSCLVERERLEQDFRRLEERAGALRSRIDELEELDPRGVPAERYDQYLESVDEYNETVPEWEGRADELQEMSDTCRALAERHNVRADSLRGFLVDAGLWEEGWEGPGGPATDDPNEEPTHDLDDDRGSEPEDPR